MTAAYICYGLKQGHVRVLARASTVRALLKGHTKPLTDLQAGGAGGVGCGRSGGLPMLGPGGLAASSTVLGWL